MEFGMKILAALVLKIRKLWHTSRTVEENVYIYIIRFFLNSYNSILFIYMTVIGIFFRWFIRSSLKWVPNKVVGISVVRLISIFDQWWLYAFFSDVNEIKRKLTGWKKNHYMSKYFKLLLSNAVTTATKLYLILEIVWHDLENVNWFQDVDCSGITELFSCVY